MTRMRTIHVAILAAALAACAGTPKPPQAPRLGLSPCQAHDSPAPLLCGSLNVPEDRSQPQRSRNLSLKVVVVPATGEKSLPPLYSLDGGPGLPATASASFWATAGAIHRQHRDIVLIDQRGTGGSNALPCAVNFASPLEPVLDLDAVRACRYRLSPRADLTQYSTAAAVADLEAVREALGHERIDLIGLSYGTRVAQEYLRLHYTRVRAVALLGTVSPAEKLPLSFSQNAQAVLTRLARQCEADAGCRRIAPKITRDIAALQAKFAAGPVRVAQPGGKTAKLEAGPFWEAVRAQLVTAASQRRLPWLLHEAAQGRFAPFLAAVESAPDAAANGLLLSVSCREDTLHISEDDLPPLRKTVFGDYRVRQQMLACSEWPGGPLPRTFSFVTSEVPTLLMAGGMDHVTPAQWAQDAASGLINSRVVTIPDLGHFPDGLSNMECYDQVINAFFEAGSATNLDLSCVATMKAPAFEAGSK